MAELKCLVSRRVFLAGLAAPLVACDFATLHGEGVEDTPFDIHEPEFAALMEDGGLACLTVGVVELLLVRSGEEVLAFDRFCPHSMMDMGPCAGNPLPGVWDSSTRRLTCRWHQSVFGEEGEVISGPSSRGIQRYEVTFDRVTGLGMVLVGGTDAAG